jgi:hypothetical protein
MEEHKRLTGLPYDPVIVFPQGRFSSVAMRALRDQGYVAAFNSNLRATDGEELPAAEYQRPDATTYHGLPLFLRRYPKDRSQFVQDIAAGRPVLIVEHHSAFRNGYEAMTDLVDWVNDLGNIRWRSLLNIAEHYSGGTAATIGHIAAPSPSSMRLNARVALRRLLSEARDSHIETSRLLNRAYRMVRG